MKQDRINPRTAIDLQRKYGRKVVKTAEVADDAVKEATQAAAAAESAAQAAATATQDLTKLEAKLDLTLKVNENGEVISEINGIANIIKFLANCIRIESDNFTLTETGSVTIKMSGGDYVRIGETVDVLAVDTDDFTDGSGSRVGITPSAIQFASGVAQASTLPIQFEYANGAFKNRLVGDWYIGNVSITDLIRRIETLEGSR